MEEGLVGPNDWIEVFDPTKNGYYYYNVATNVTTWAVPESFTRWKSAEIDSYLKRIKSTWRRHADEKGKYFYYNKADKKTQWNAPEVVTEFVTWLMTLVKRRFKKRKKEEMKLEAQEEASKIPRKEVVNQVAMTEEKAVPLAAPAREKEVEAEEVYDWGQGGMEETTTTAAEAAQGADSALSSAVKDEDNEKEQLEALKSQLSAIDAVMESDILHVFTRFVEVSTADSSSSSSSSSSLAAQQEGISHLVQGYRGLAQMSCIASSWLHLAKTLTSTPPPLPQTTTTAAVPIDDNTIKEQVSSQIESLVLSTTSSFITDHFSASIADELLSKQVSKPVWLLDLVNDDVWRKLLIRLFDQHRESSLLGFCIRKISSAGYHR